MKALRNIADLVPGGWSPDSLVFAEPGHLWLLAVPATLWMMAGWRLLRHRLELCRYTASRALPMREALGWGGDLPFWFCVLLASALAIVALARPQARIAITSRAGADLVILQDASASMHVADVLPNRWQRSQQFLRTLAETLSWQGDRVALALFASRAAPQLRLTKDPNALFFFFDRLGERSPFALENATTWDTNIEEGIDWGLKLIEADEELFGRSRNAKALILVSDGQDWSGEMQRALERARERRVIVHVVGVGTAIGGLIPQPAGEATPRLRSVLDQRGLREIARYGGGEYFEIGREPDRQMALRLIASVRSRSVASKESTASDEDPYWYFLFATAVMLIVGVLLLRKRIELWWHAGGAIASLGLLVVLMNG